MAYTSRREEDDGAVPRPQPASDPAPTAPARILGWSAVPGVADAAARGDSARRRRRGGFRGVWHGCRLRRRRRRRRCDRLLLRAVGLNLVAKQ